MDDTVHFCLRPLDVERRSSLHTQSRLDERVDWHSSQFKRLVDNWSIQSCLQTDPGLLGAHAEALSTKKDLTETVRAYRAADYS